MDDRKHKVWHTPASKRELEEIDNCRLCQILPELADTCYATRYCHRQLKMEGCEKSAEPRESG